MVKAYSIVSVLIADSVEIEQALEPEGIANAAWVSLSTGVLGCVEHPLAISSRLLLLDGAAGGE